MFSLCSQRLSMCWHVDCGSMHSQASPHVTDLVLANLTGGEGGEGEGGEGEGGAGLGGEGLGLGAATLQSTLELDPLRLSRLRWYIVLPTCTPTAAGNTTGNK